ncbi:peptidase family M50 [Methanobrevibacter cuticularis]|uniref:Peptidase family M50 n=1 Tax=Methanobrevibacter cuticularis TaxID=47311 RepID=A0A166D333_9EURY|nr:site-2 protease family protein [Methanobrevibacter cuticularis]KZX15156.1 peptidase family M50 [Methanobrevibacter cuticularis]
MDALWYYAIAFVVIWATALLFRNKLVDYGVTVEFPTIMWKTKRLRGFIDKIANLSPKFWKWFMIVGIFVSFGAMAVMTYLLFNSLSTVIDAPAVSLVIPGVSIPGSPIFVPFVYGIIGLATVVVVHEFSHGILARVEKINIKSIGLLLFAVLPGAFVEPDGDDMEIAKRSSRMRVYAAGSIANMSLFVIAFLITLTISSFVIPGNFQQTGVEIDRVIADSPSANVLKPGMIIEAINGVNVTDSNTYMDAVSTLKPGKPVYVTTNQGNYNFTAGTNPNNNSAGYMGIQAINNYEIKENTANIYGNQLPWVWFSLLEMFNWIAFLNLAVGLFNILPMKPLDGGHLLEELLSYKLKESIVKPIINFSSGVIIIVIAISLFFGLAHGFF